MALNTCFFMPFGHYANTGNRNLDAIVKEVNVHNHTKSCQKGGKGCRFSFPRLPSNETLVAHPIPEDDRKKPEFKEKLRVSKNILSLVKTNLAELSDEDIETKYKNDLDKFLTSLSISTQEYHAALRISERGKTIILKRALNERKVNNYNPHFLMVWNANMDIQFSLDSYAIVTYITDYMTKGDAALTKELKEALLNCKQCNDWETLNYLKMVYFKHKQVSVAEATYRLLNGLCLKRSNITCTFITTGFPRNRSSFFTPIDSVPNSSDAPDDVEPQDDDATDVNNNDPVGLSGRTKKFKEVDTIHKKYSERPTSLDDICLAQFGTSYRSINSVPKDVEWNENISFKVGVIKKFGKPDLLPKFIKLTSGGFMALRIRPVILRIHASKKKEAHEGIYSELLLFFPWRNENDLYENDPILCEALFNTHKQAIKSNKALIFPNAPMIDTIKELLETNDTIKPTHLSDTVNIDSTAQQNNIQDQEELEEVNPLDTSDLPAEAGDDNRGSKPDGCPYKPVVIPSRDEMFSRARSLSFAQRIVFDKVVNYCKSIIMAERSGDPSTMEDPPHLIVHGKLKDLFAANILI